MGTLLAVAKGLNLQSIDELLAPTGLTLFDRHDELEEVLGEAEMAMVMRADVEPEQGE